MGIEFKRNEKGELDAYENGKKTGNVETMGDVIKEEPEEKETNYGSSNIKKLLKVYGASDKEIDNFMKDLAELVQKAEDITDGDKEFSDKVEKHIHEEVMGKYGKDMKDK